MSFGTAVTLVVTVNGLSTNDFIALVNAGRLQVKIAPAGGVWESTTLVATDSVTHTLTVTVTHFSTVAAFNVPATNTGASNSGGLSTSLIIVIAAAAGGTLLLLVIVLVSVIVVHKRRRRSSAIASHKRTTHSMVELISAHPREDSRDSIATPAPKLQSIFDLDMDESEVVA